MATMNQANGERSGYKNLRSRPSNKGTHNESMIKKGIPDRRDTKFSYKSKRKTSPCDF